MEFYDTDDVVDNKYDDFLETIGLDDFLSGRDFGHERGRDPDITEARRQALNKLASKLQSKSSSRKMNTDEDAEDIIQFDIVNPKRVLLYEGKASKKSLNAIVNHLSKRYLFLFNDVLIVTSAHSGSASILKSSDKYSIHQVFYLDRISISSYSEAEPNNSQVFEIHTQDRAYTFVAENDTEKKIWMEELELSILALHAKTAFATVPGWQYQVVRDSIYSAAFLGNTDQLQVYLDKLDGQSPDIADKCGMCPIHWAALAGNKLIVLQLLEAGSEVDCLNNGLNSPLLLAAARGHEQVIRTLLDHGANVHLRNLKDRDVLFMAVLYGHTCRGLANTLKMLRYQGVDFDQMDSTGAAPLHECAARNLSRPIHLLVEAGAKVNNKHGRTGVTPLQLACSVENPDVETIRSFLDSGAFPNWKDSYGKSAFELVLRTHESKNVGVRPNDDGRQPGEDMYNTVDRVGNWVLQALPVLLEIVRKGGRYTEESVEHLRLSFKEAIHSACVMWNKADVPECYDDFLQARQSLISSDFLPDSSSDVCLLCVDKFGRYSNRRHHCRACGILCCALCSCKRVRLVYAKSPPTPKDMHRVCDGCFNRLCNEAILRHMAVTKAKKDLEKVQSDRLFDTGGVDDEDTSSLRSPDSSKLSHSDITSAMNSAMTETAAALKERGEKLQSAADKSEQMANAANEFRQMTRQLLKNQQQQNIWSLNSSSSL